MWVQGLWVWLMCLLLKGVVGILQNLEPQFRLACVSQIFVFQVSNEPVACAVVEIFPRLSAEVLSLHEKREEVESVFCEV